MGTIKSASTTGSLRKIDAVVRLSAKDRELGAQVMSNPTAALQAHGIGLTQDETVAYLDIMGKTVESTFLHDATAEHGDWIAEMRDLAKA
ncbi:hypothetical protein [uncultured Roseobacter sp.]|uniref:hypothetical protein n=1 Tax=uncultured Roseobacter sp. TaxID=114847 RepID=UPI00262B822A|nr:hypothetical protein [uncultured Roseobacter sp.]